MALRTARVPAPSDGMDTDTSPNIIPATRGVVVQNYLPGERGRVRQRGSINTLDTGPLDGGGLGPLALPASDKLLYGNYVKDAVRFVPPWMAVWRPTVAGALAKAAVGANQAEVYDIAAGTSTDVTPTSREYLPNGNRSTKFGKFAYAIAYDSINDTAQNASVGTVADGIENTNYGTAERLTRIMRWDSSGVLNPVIYAIGPRGAQDLRIHYNRLLVLGGRNPVTLTEGIDHNAIWYTRALTANDFASGINNADAANTIWTDEVSGAVNKLSLADDRGDPAVAMAPVGRALAILKRRSIDVLSGFDSSSFQVRTASRGVGCIDPHSVVEVPEGVYFLSQQGFVFFDGVQVKIVSRSINTVLLPYVAQMTRTDIGYTFLDASAVLLDNSYILLNISSQGDSTAASSLTKALLFHIPTGTWATIVPAAGGLDNLVKQSESFQIGLDVSSGGTLTISDLRSITNPGALAESVRGKDGSTTIQTKWHSRIVELASPLYKAQIHRVIVDYEWIVDGAASEGLFIGPTISLYNSNGSLLDANTLPSQQDAGHEVTRGRFVWDTYAETSDVQVQIDYTGTARALVASSIIDVWIEFEQAAESRGVFG